MTYFLCMNMKDRRITYIDNLKGFTIIIVVMGHVIEKGMGITDSYINVLYSSFHMPLFIFLSGLFALKSFNSFNIVECVSFFCNKVRRIFVPFLTVGGAFSLFVSGSLFPVYLGRTTGYWFLPVLFYAMIVEMIASWFLYRIHSYNRKWIDALLHILFIGIVSIGYYETPLAKVPYFLYFIKMYPFFVFGIWVNKYSKLKQILLNSKGIFSISVVLFCFFAWLQEMIRLPIKVSGLFAIIVLMNLFYSYNDRICRHLTKIGRYSLQIYVFHWFMIPSIIPLGTWMYYQGNPLGGLPNENTILLLIVALVFAFPIVAACMVLGKIVKHSYWLNLLLFGGK